MNLRREARWIWPIAAIMAIAVVCGGYILNQQRLDSPFAERYAVHLEFDAVDAVTPGLGSPITVAGVAVGQIDRATLEDGRGLLRASVDPDELPAVYADATAALVPNTPLEDMQIRIFPGRRRDEPLPAGATIPLARTTTQVESDELLQTLDADTRDWMRVMLAELGRAGKGRGRDLNEVLRKLGPTAAQVRRISGLLAERRDTIARLVHDLRVISDATAESDDELRLLVDAGHATFRTLAANEQPLRRTLELLPPTLADARSTLAGVRPLAESLSQALTRLDPSLRDLRETLRNSPDALRGLVPLPAGELTGFVDSVAPLAASVRPAARDLAASAPLLENAFGVLGRATNALTYKADADSQSYLFYLAWFAHNAASALSTQDAHGASFRGYAMFSCASSGSQVLEALIGAQCPEDGAA
jgi:phospholipid/cholesterol/gamma-HCH transport system substrate-binding protein